MLYITDRNCESVKSVWRSVALLAHNESKRTNMKVQNNYRVGGWVGAETGLFLAKFRYFLLSFCRGFAFYTRFKR